MQKSKASFLVHYQILTPALGKSESLTKPIEQSLKKYRMHYLPGRIPGVVLKTQLRANYVGCKKNTQIHHEPLLPSMDFAHKSLLT